VQARSHLAALSLVRNFLFGERYRIQFRAESFNIMNHPNLGIPNATIGTAGAPVNGIASTDGSLVTHQANLTKQSADIDTQISNLEKQVLAYQTQMTNELVAMETAEAKTNQQMQFLQQNFSSSSSSKA